MTTENNQPFSFGEDHWYNTEPADPEEVARLDSCAQQLLAEVPLVTERYYVLGDQKLGAIIIGTTCMPDGSPEPFLRVCRPGELSVETAIFHMQFLASGKPDSGVRILGETPEQIREAQQEVEAVCSRLKRGTNLLPDESTVLGLLQETAQALIAGDEPSFEDYDAAIATNIEPLVRQRSGNKAVLTKTFDLEVPDLGRVSVAHDTDLDNNNDIRRTARRIHINFEDGDITIFYQEFGQPAQCVTYDEEGNLQTEGAPTVAAVAELIPALKEALYDKWMMDANLGITTENADFPQNLRKLLDAHAGYRALAREVGLTDDTRVNAKAVQTLDTIQKYFEACAHLLRNPLGNPERPGVTTWNQTRAASRPTGAEEARGWAALHYQQNLNLLEVATKECGVISEDSGADILFYSADHWNPTRRPVILHTTQRAQRAQFIYENVATFLQGEGAHARDRVVAMGHFVHDDFTRPPTFIPGLIFLDIPDDSTAHAGNMN